MDGQLFFVFLGYLVVSHVGAFAPSSVSRAISLAKVGIACGEGMVGTTNRFSAIRTFRFLHGATTLPNDVRVAILAFIPSTMSNLALEGLSELRKDLGDEGSRECLGFCVFRVRCQNLLDKRFNDAIGAAKTRFNMGQDEEHGNRTRRRQHGAPHGFGVEKTEKKVFRLFHVVHLVDPTDVVMHVSRTNLIE